MMPELRDEAIPRANRASVGARVQGYPLGVVWRRALRASVLVTLLLLGYFVAPVEPQLHPSGLARLVGTLLVLGALAAGLTRMLRLHVRDEERRVEGLVLGIVVVVVVFAFGFYALEYHQPGQVAGLHTRIDALYYTVATLSTIGYGDVHAVGQAARVLVMVQVVFDLVFVAAAANLLTSHLRATAQQPKGERDEQDHTTP
jgi:voltage-gated potassium channel